MWPIPGFGIPDDQLSLVFARFKRINHPDHVKVQGTGLGLSMVKELVEAHGGNISVRSELAKGSTFRVELPLAESARDGATAGVFEAKHAVDIELNTLTGEQAGAVVDSPALPSDSNEDGKTSVLVIEDTTQMREFLVSLFDNRYEVYSAPDGEQGIALAKQKLPDIVVSDVMMPGKNGYEVCAELKSDEATCHIPIILLTAKADLQSRMQGWKEQADEYLAKPFDEDELQMRVTNLLGIRKTLKQRFGRTLHEAPEQLPTLAAELNEKDQGFLDRFHQLIADKFNDCELNLPTVAGELFVSERLLQKKLKALLDHNFTEYLRTYRLNQAKQMLSAGVRISDVWDETGFSSQAYFARCFKAEFGQTATQFIQQQKG